MVVFVIVMVIVLSLLAMGYQLDEQGRLDQSGLIQIQSQPTGAKISIDDGEILARTNTNKMLSAGEHKVKIEKEGYGSWEKTVEIQPGWLLKLDYPRLYRTEMPIEAVRDFSAGLAFFATSPDRNHLLYAEKGRNYWIYMNVRSDEVIETKVDLSQFEESFTVKNVQISENGDRALTETDKGWILVNLRDSAQSVNLSEEFGVEISRIEMITGAGERLMILEQGNLREVSVTDKKLSAVMATGVSDFAVDDSNVVYVKNGQVFLYKNGGKDVKLTEIAGEKQVKVTLSLYLANSFLSISVDNRLFVYRGRLGDSLDEMKLVAENDIADKPTEVKVLSGGRLILAKSGKNIAMFDAELGKTHQYEMEAENYRMTDEFTIAVVADGKLIVRDFDGENRKELIPAENYPATVIANGRWVYYVNEGKIMRAKIVL